MYLNCHSYYSLRYGILAPEQLAETAVSMGIEAMALTDINNTTGMVDFVKACLEHGVKPVGGIEFRRDGHLLYIGIALNNDGFYELNEFLTWHNVNKKPLPPVAPEFNAVFVIYPFGAHRTVKLRENEFFGVWPSQVNKLISSPFSHDQSKLVALHPVTFLSRDHFEVHRHLRAVDLNTLLSKLTPADMATPGDRLVPYDLILPAYEEYPAIVRNTNKLMDACQLCFDFNTVKNKRTFTRSRSDDWQLLHKLAMEGMEYRYGRSNAEALRRVLHELDVIDKLGFAAYFLITWDVIRYSMSRGFYHVGRGSGANSIVAYCLRITDVDPIELDLYFERFINPKRTSPPDFDIDFSWKERDEVLDYIFKRYGEKHTAFIGTISTFRGRSIFRELGKVYGLPKEEIDALVANPQALVNESGLIRKIFDVGNAIADFPNIRSIHAGGVLISEEPITRYTSLDMPPKGFVTTQWDMYVAETLRYEKLDILSQRGLGHIQECRDIVRRNREITIDVHQVSKFKQDPLVNQRLIDGETNGCFYIESPAMRGLLKKLRCNNYLALVAASSIIRPGVAKSGMMKEYIKRFHNPKGFKYLHPVMEQQLKETYGVMVYQEDVIKICHHFAGLDLSDADILRRAMAGKFRSKAEFARIRDKFFSNCRQRGYADALAAEVWRQVESFAGYAFSKAHSASYAVESYQSLYLKTYYPMEFMVAVINNFGGFYRTAVYVNEARRSGANIHLPCVNHSEYKTTITGKDIYLGFIHVQNLETAVAKKIPDERARGGPFKSLGDFVRRVPLTMEQFILLIRVDALRFTGKHKKELLWQAHMLVNKRKKVPESMVLFETARKKYQLPKLEQNRLEDVYDEVELLGFPVTATDFDLLQTAFRGEVFAHNLRAHAGKMVRMLGSLVTIKNVRTVKKEWMHFGCFHDVHGEFFDTVHFPNSLREYPFRGNGVYLILGKVVEEFDFPSVEVQKMAKLPVHADPRYG